MQAGILNVCTVGRPNPRLEPTRAKHVGIVGGLGGGKPSRACGSIAIR